MLDDLLVSATQLDLERAREHAARIRALREATRGEASEGAPYARRLLRVLSDLYGARRPSADPALFSRFAWAGLDGD
jgi:hypothetical protein